MVTYILAETLSTLLFVRGIIEPHSIWFMEKTPGQSHVRFDPYIGYKISNQPHIFGCYNTNAGVVSSGLSVGNNYGFPDSKDFHPQKNKKRLLILGDSFTAGQYLKVNWPSKVEEMQREQKQTEDQDFEIYNMALDGGGLANWWLTLENVIKKDRFEADALLIMALNENFNRSFMWWDDSLSEERRSRPPHFMYLDYQKDWDHRSFPRSRKDLGGFPAHLFHLLTPDQVQALKKGDFKIPTQRSYQPYMLSRVLKWLSINKVDAEEPLIAKNEQKKMLEDFAHWSKKNRVPIYVVFFDGDHPDHSFILDLLQANEIKAEAWLTQNSQDASKLFIPLDGHFNQKGSDLWAEYMLKKINGIVSAN